MPNGLRCDHWKRTAPINILEGAVRSGKTWSLIPKISMAAAYPVGGRKVLTGVSKQSVYNNVLTDLFDWVGPRNYSYNQSTGQLKLSDRVAGHRRQGRRLRTLHAGITIGIAICDELSLMPQSFFQMLLTRMSPEARVCTVRPIPDSPYHWLKTDYLNNARATSQRHSPLGPLHDGR